MLESPRSSTYEALSVWLTNIRSAGGFFSRAAAAGKKLFKSVGIFAGFLRCGANIREPHTEGLVSRCPGRFQHRNEFLLWQRVQTQAVNNTRPPVEQEDSGHAFCDPVA